MGKLGERNAPPPSAAGGREREKGRESGKLEKEREGRKYKPSLVMNCPPLSNIPVFNPTRIPPPVFFFGGGGGGIN